MHEANCRCGACVMVRGYLDRFHGRGDHEHPVCCVCPLCAATRTAERQFAAMPQPQTTYQGAGYGRGAGVNSWWTDETRSRMIEALQQYIDGPAIPSYRAPWPYLAHATRTPIDEPLEKRDSDSVAAFDLLHDLGIPIRKDNP